jgi:predicted nucleic acid-binding protein
VRGYLLDTNHVTAREKRNPKFMERLRKTPPENQMRVSAITIGELECGHLITTTTDAARRAEANAFIQKEVLPYCLDVTHATRIYYAQILERIWRKHPPPEGKGTEAHLVQNGVDINDVWTVALAWEHNLTLLTADSMAVIKASVPEVAFENWIA